MKSDRYLASCYSIHSSNDAIDEANEFEIDDQSHPGRRFQAALLDFVRKACFISRFQKPRSGRAMSLYCRGNDLRSDLGHKSKRCLKCVQIYISPFSHAILFPLCLSVPSLVNSASPQINPVWLPGDTTFWYRSESAPETERFVLIDATTGKRNTAPDLASLGLPDEAPVKSSSIELELRSTERTGVTSGLRLVNNLEQTVNIFWINQDGEYLPYGTLAAKAGREQHSYEGHVWLVTDERDEPIAVFEVGATPRTFVIDGKGAAPAEPASPKAGPGQVSPDGKWSARVERGTVVLRDLAGGRESTLTAALGEKEIFRGGITWAPDSSTFIVSASAPVTQRRITLVESMPKDSLQPTRKEIDYTKPGDALPKPTLVLFQPGSVTQEGRVIDSTLFAEPFTQSHEIRGEWSPDGKEFYFNYNERGHQRFRVLAVNAHSGSVRVVVEESAKTFIDYSQKTSLHWFHGSGELIWMSERDGWAHLYLYDIANGKVKNQITRGAWPVREVLHVDAEERQVWFLASGLRAGEDPYHLHLCRVNFDGSDFRRLSEGDGTHRFDFSPTREWFIDSWSRVDQAPVHELRRSDDGSLVCELERDDLSSLAAQGWAAPEPFTSKGRDGETDIYGVIFKPASFDPAKKYAVLESIYAGPHSAFVPKDFGPHTGLHQMADEGFIVVKIDGMGTNHRGKDFHDVAWKNLKDAGFPDRIAWIKAAASSRPWMDLSRVGIYGGSAGGQSAMRALLDHHDFYHVAVADCGCHDNRMDKIWWNEQWMGWPVDESYAASSNAADAAKLAGKLLLIVGELDTNVDPASTTQVVAALQKAGKEFDYMPIIGAGHGAAETEYGSQVRIKFLKKHLLK